MDDYPVYHFTTRSAAETLALGRLVGRHLIPGQVVALHGDLGAGKTTFTQGIGQGLGVTVRITSPTFTLVNEYAGPAGVILIHVDSYRLGEGGTGAQSEERMAVLEAAALGMAEILERTDGVIVVEWAERLAPLLPDDFLEVRLSAPIQDPWAHPETREMVWIAHGPHAAATLQALASGQPWPVEA